MISCAEPVECRAPSNDPSDARVSCGSMHCVKAKYDWTLGNGRSQGLRNEGLPRLFLSYRRRPHLGCSADSGNLPTPEWYRNGRARGKGALAGPGGAPPGHGRFEARPRLDPDDRVEAVNTAAGRALPEGVHSGAEPCWRPVIAIVANLGLQQCSPIGERANWVAKSPSRAFNSGDSRRAKRPRPRSRHIHVRQIQRIIFAHIGRWGISSWR